MNIYSVYYGLEDLTHRGSPDHELYGDWEYLGLYNGKTAIDATITAMDECSKHYGAFRAIPFVRRSSGASSDVDTDEHRMGSRCFAISESARYDILANRGTAYCVKCAKDTSYTVRQERLKGSYKEKEYPFIGLEAKCSECGTTLKLQEIDDDNRASLEKSAKEAEKKAKEKEKEESDFTKKKEDRSADFRK